MSATAELLADLLAKVDEVLDHADLDICVVEDLHRVRATITTRLRSVAPFAEEAIR